ncbi:MAG: ATP-binding protein [Anaerolineae bacterium]|nr:ATP-binding protein [Anaerolineae bacterium]
MNETIGYVVGGGLKEGLNIRLTIPADQVQEGSFVVCDSGPWRYFGLITDLQLGATDPRFADEQGDRLQPAIRAQILGKTLFTTLTMFPTLMVENQPDIEVDKDGYWEWQERADQGEISPRPVKTVPAHHSPVRLADAFDVELIFRGDFVIGTTIEEPHHPVKLDLGKLVKRSSGIFGATGTGKSFLTRMVLAGVMKGDVASALVFDMHNEYGVGDTDSDRGVRVEGLRDLFGRTRVQLAALGAGATIRGKTPDFTLELPTSDFLASDMLLLSDAIGLNESATIVLDALENSFSNNWFREFMALVPGKTEEYEDENGRIKKAPAPDSVEAWARSNNIHEKSATALHRKLVPIFRKPYVTNKEVNPVSSIVDQLQNGKHVVLSFGEFESDLDYLLVSNILTRRIRAHWVELTNKHKSDGAPAPKPLMIAIEEAHKLLNPQLARHTSFGIIARELRKYYVTLLVIDQRPSGIDDEIMSQLGTRITGWLGDEDDIRAVLSGLAGRDQLRGMLARLQEKEEVLLLGWGVKMPIPVRSRRYDDDFYADMRGKDTPQARAKHSTKDFLDDTNDALYG